MKTKIFEVLDAATCMPVIATKLDVNFDTVADIKHIKREMQLLSKLGLGYDGSFKILLSIIGSGYADSQIDPFEWTQSRTRHVAHKYIEEHFDILDNGAVVDVQFILKECEEPHQSGLEFDFEAMMEKE